MEGITTKEEWMTERQHLPRHVAETFSREVETHEGTDWVEWEIFCGEWRGGEKVLCPEHLLQAQEEYPQGWLAYPGDICRHGTYTGGCGRDLMCHECEMGYDTWYDDPMYELEFRTVYDAHWLPSSRHWRASIMGEAVESVRQWAEKTAQAFGPEVSKLEYRVVRSDYGYWGEANE